MLYLVRKIDESIIINGNIEIKLIDVKGKSAKLGFDFPASATVLRKEIHDRIVAENLAAALSDNSSDMDMDIDFTDAMSKVNIGKKSSDKEDG